MMKLKDIWWFTAGKTVATDIWSGEQYLSSDDGARELMAALERYGEYQVIKVSADGDTLNVEVEEV